MLNDEVRAGKYREWSAVDLTSPKTGPAGLVAFIVFSVAVTTNAVARERPPVLAVPLRDELVRQRADALIAQMTPEEKAGQLSLVAIPRPTFARSRSAPLALIEQSQEMPAAFRCPGHRAR